MSLEDKVAKKIVSYLDDSVSPDISARLQFARLNALKNIKRAKTPWYKNLSNIITLPQLTSRVVVAMSVAVAVLMIGSSTYLMQDNDEISYHVEADRLPSYIIDDI